MLTQIPNRSQSFGEKVARSTTGALPRRRFVRPTRAIVSVAVGLLVSAAGTTWAQKPNVIVFLADDMGIGDTSAYLGKRLEATSDPIPVTVNTPNLDRLAQRGTVFTDAHSASTMCTTSRYAMLTGRYAQRSYTKIATINANWTGPVLIDPQRETMATMFQRAGYATSMFGKWHLGANMLDNNGNRYVGPGSGPSISDFNQVRWPTAENPAVESIADGPRQHGFDYFYGTLSNYEQFTGNFRGFFENNTLQGVPQWQPPSGTSGGPYVPAPDWEAVRTGERLANHALDAIDAHAGANGQPASDKPFFMYYSSMSPHSPYNAAESINLQGTNHAIRGQASWSNGAVHSLREDMVYENDVILGAMLDKLESTIDPQTGGPMIDNTLIVFTSDHGAGHSYFRFSPGMRDYKQSIYEGGHRVPFLASWPGKIPQNAVSDQVFGLNDLYATFAAINGVELAPTEAEDSENVLPALMGQTTAQFQRPSNLMIHDNTLLNDIPKGAVVAIRSGNFKLILSRDLVNVPAQSPTTAGQAIPVGFYDLSVDLHEDANLLNEPAYAAQIESMRLQALQYFNQGFTRSTIQSEYGPLVGADGGTDLMNNITGAVGYEFTVGARPVAVTRLGMWDDAADDIINQETNYPNPDGDTVGLPDGLTATHTIRLFDKGTGLELASAEINMDNSELLGEYQYVNLPDAIELSPGTTYALTMSTTAGDGDLFHAPAPVTGASPMTSSLVRDFVARRAATDGVYPTLLPNGNLSTGSLTESMFAHRLFGGPTAMLAEIPGGGGVIPLEMVDFNADGYVDGADFLVWQRGVGMLNPTHADGDADGNGFVDGDDLNYWRTYIDSYNLPPTTPTVGAVPEPASAVLALLTLAAALVGRRLR